MRDECEWKVQLKWESESLSASGVSSGKKAHSGTITRGIWECLPRLSQHSRKYKLFSCRRGSFARLASKPGVEYISLLASHCFQHSAFGM